VMCAYDVEGSCIC